ncbi:hypothetical protein [Phycicoccus sp. DTK01]|uniref:hypothetical protein n=1 Tax=Phycicoccus sp. DTK01 TaxID=2785745 RepID=UPI001A8C796B|nr:hypothetical protein [Phycicoccus sp. DTK01]GIL35669.1 hypothetical protein PDTK01_17440 [Phycicoccus sp. DTK01]
MATAACVALALSVPASAVPRDVPVGTGVPVLGQVLVSGLGQGEERPPSMVVTVHAVRRTEGATILYYSVGFAGEAPDPEVLPVTAYGSGLDTFGTLQASSGATFMDTAALVDVPGKRSYGALRTAAGRAVAAPPPVAGTDRVRLSGRAVMQWVALAPVPAKVRTVDVLVGSAFVPGIPVGDGLLEPTVEDPAPVVGTGWPRVDTVAIGGARADSTIKTLQVHVARRPVASPPPEPTASPGASPSPTASPAP